MADQSLRLKPIAPLSNSIRGGPVGGITHIKIAEALDLMNQNLLAVAARLQDIAATDVVEVTDTIAYPDRS